VGLGAYLGGIRGKKLWIATPWQLIISCQMNATGQQVRENTIKSIQEAVAHLFNLSINELTGDSSRRVVAVPRQIAMYLAKQMTTASLSEIGLYFGGRHHTTVMHSIAKVHELRRSDAALDHTLTNLLMSLTQRSR